MTIASLTLFSWFLQLLTVVPLELQSMDKSALSIPPWAHQQCIGAMLAFDWMVWNVVCVQSQGCGVTRPLSVYVSTESDNYSTLVVYFQTIYHIIQD